MVEKEILRRRLNKLEEYLAYLREAQTYSETEFTSEPEKFGSVERFLHLSVEAVNAMASHIVADRTLGTVERAQDLPKIFAEQDLIDSALEETSAGMIGFRNVLVHDYVDIDRSKVYDILQDRLSDIERLQSLFAEFL